MCVSGFEVLVHVPKSHIAPVHEAYSSQELKELLVLLEPKSLLNVAAVGVIAVIQIHEISLKPPLYS